VVTQIAVDDVDPDELAKQMEDAETWYDFGPFEPPLFCDKKYPGIETTCQEEATHRWSIEYRGRREEMLRCDEHGHPWAVRVRRERALGHPLCQVCGHRDLFKRIQPNDPVGTFETVDTEGEEMTAYACAECEDHFDLDLEPI